jgi:hypothetical protein
LVGKIFKNSANVGRGGNEITGFIKCVVVGYEKWDLL